VLTHERFGLPRWDADPAYWEKVAYVAKQLGTDGCTAVVDIYIDSCFEHDIHCRTHQTLYGRPLTSADAAAIFRERIQQQSVLGRLSPVSWWRWAAVRVFGPQWY